MSQNYKWRGMTAVERFHSRIEIAPPCDCWVWSGALNANGYGNFRLPNEGSINAHRAAYKLLVGAVDDSLDIHHTCGMRCCVNPGHLVPVSKSEHSRHHRIAEPPREFCKRGHQLSGNNVRVYRGARHCRACKRKSSGYTRPVVDCANCGVASPNYGFGLCSKCYRKQRRAKRRP